MGSFIRSLETTNKIVSLIRTQLIGNLPPSYFNDFFDKIQNISKQELFKVQKKYMKPENLIITAVGKADYIADIMSDYGKITVLK
jgi:predicted Zn-dependent peptidase